jgi:hypothetical protein
MTLTIASLTSNIVTSATFVVTGDGVFDKLMETVNSHLDAQYKLGRITGADYATVYLGALQATVQQAVAYLLGQEKTNSEVDLLTQKSVTEFAQTNQTTKVAADPDSVMGKQQTLYGEQAKGFKWNADQKYLKTIMDAWSINISTAGVAATGIDAINETGTGNINTQISDAKPVA